MAADVGDLASLEQLRDEIITLFLNGHETVAGLPHLIPHPAAGEEHAYEADIVVERRLINYEPMGVDISDVIGRKEGGRPAIGGGVGSGFDNAQPSGDPRTTQRNYAIPRGEQPRVGFFLARD
jgi:hypothetical protein